MDLYLEENTRTILVKLYGNEARAWEINDRVVNVVFEMLQQGGVCTRLVEYVPKPYNPFSNPLKALGKQAIKGLFKKAADNDISLVCMKGIAAPYKQKIISAAY